MNHEQKIAEIREKHSTGHYNYNYEIRDAIQFLLDELERMEREYAEERAAHNAHVAELEQERNMYKSSSEVFYERLQKENDELAEALRFYAVNGGEFAREVLRKYGLEESRNECW